MTLAPFARPSEQYLVRTNVLGTLRKLCYSHFLSSVCERAGGTQFFLANGFVFHLPPFFLSPAHMRRLPFILGSSVRRTASVRAAVVARVACVFRTVCADVEGGSAAGRSHTRTVGREERGNRRTDGRTHLCFMSAASLARSLPSLPSDVFRHMHQFL